MRRTVALLTSLVVLFSCIGSRKPEINAPELGGLGTLSLGMTTSEAEEALAESGSSLKDKEHYYTYMRSRAEEIEDYKEKESVYFVSEDTKLKLTLGFYKDTLLIVRVPGRWLSEGAETVREAFKAKYGDGALYGSERGYGLTETWRSEDVKAVYFLQDDNNRDLSKRKILEYVEILPSGRDIKRELANYDEAIATEKESQRRESLKGL